MLNQKESEFLDFKLKWHEDNAELIHDILCLSNSNFEGPRFLIIGASDEGVVEGVSENDKTRKTQAQLYDLIGNSNFNIIPELRVSTVKVNNRSNKKIDVIQIENKPEKPYFLLKDKKFRNKNKVVRTGVVYSRLADRNTPINSCVDDKKLEKMFLERFSLHLTPTERFNRYLCDLKGWQIQEGIPTFYQKYPEFTIKEDSEEGFFKNYFEPWVGVYPDAHATGHTYNIMYHSTILDQRRVIFCDGCRVKYIEPKIKYTEDNCYFYRFYYYIFDSYLYNLQQLFFGSPTDTRAYVSPIAFVESEKKAERIILEIQSNQVKDNTGIYLLEKSSRKWFYKNHNNSLKEVVKAQSN